MLRRGIAATAIVETKNIGCNVSIGEFAIIRQGVTVGDGVVIHPQAIIEEDVTLGTGAEIFPFAHLGRVPKGGGPIAREPRFKRELVVGAHASVGDHSVLYYDVRIGGDTLIGDGVSIREQVDIGELCVIGRHVTINYNTQIGNRTKIMDGTHITGNCTIGSDVFISVLVATTNDHGMGMQGYGVERIRGPEIGDRVRIGAAANIWPGVKIGDEATVATGAIVTRDVPPGVLVAGAPARAIPR